MKKRISLVIFLVLACISSFSFAEDRVGKGGYPAYQASLLTGSKMGQCVGFVDVNGDGVDDKIVGAPDAASFSETGAVLVYRGGSQGGFSRRISILSGDDDNFGFSFANLGDVDGDGKDDFAVGAIHGDGPDISLSGSVILYKGGRKWNDMDRRSDVIVKLSGEGAMDKFGLFITAGDLNGDGANDLIVGAPFNTNDPAIYQGGAVYVYFAPSFTRKVALRASSLNKGLGWSAAAGDINGDGVPDLCISASGKVLCYYGGQDFNPSIDAPDVVIKSASAGFGKALAVIGDLNGDGFGEILIGAPNAVISGNRDTGSVYIVTGGTGIRSVNADTSPSDLIVRIDGAALFDRFGSSILPVGDFDGDQKPDFAVGAPMADAEALVLAGKVYVFKGQDISAATTLADSTIFEGFAKNQGYGTSLAAAKGKWLLIGAPKADADTGAVDLIDLASGQAESE